MKWIWKLFRNQILSNIEVDIDVDVAKLKLCFRVEIFGDPFINKCIDLDGETDAPDAGIIQAKDRTVIKADLKKIANSRV